MALLWKGAPLMENERQTEYYCVPDSSSQVTINIDGIVSFPSFYSPEDKQRWIEEFKAMVAQGRIDIDAL